MAKKKPARRAVSTVTKAHLTSEVAETLGISKRQAKDTIDLFLRLVGDHATRFEDPVSLPGFGKFSIHRTEARADLTFRPAKALSDSVSLFRR